MALKRPRTLGIVALAVVALLVIAWIDGGEEPLRPIVQEIEVPESVK